MQWPHETGQSQTMVGIILHWKIKLSNTNPLKIRGILGCPGMGSRLYFTSATWRAKRATKRWEIIFGDKSYTQKREKDGILQRQTKHTHDHLWHMGEGETKSRDDYTFRSDEFNYTTIGKNTIAKTDYLCLTEIDLRLNNNYLIDEI